MQDRDQVQTEAAADDKPKQAEFRQADPGDNPVGEDGKTERQREVEHSQARALRQQQPGQRNGDRNNPVGSAPVDPEFRRYSDARHGLQQGGAPTLDPRNRHRDDRPVPGQSGRGFSAPEGEHSGQENLPDGQSDEQRAVEAKKVEADAGHQQAPSDREFKQSPGGELGGVPQSTGADGNGGVVGKPDDGSQQGDGAKTDGQGAGDGEHGKGSDV